MSHSTTRTPLQLECRDLYRELTKLIAKADSAFVPSGSHAAIGKLSNELRYLRTQLVRHMVAEDVGE